METLVADLFGKLKRAFPLATVQADPPLRAEGVHYIDVRLGGRLVVVSWDHANGFGVSLIDEPALEGGPDVRVTSLEDALREVSKRLRRVALSARDKARYLELLTNDSPDLVAMIPVTVENVEAPVELGARDQAPETDGAFRPPRAERDAA